MSAHLIDAKDLTRHYKVGGGLLAKKNTVEALSQVSFKLEAGKTLAVVGESGCGKSTLARLVTMIEPPTSGTLEISGENVDKAKESAAAQAKLRQSIQIVFQDPYGSLNPRHKIGAILEEPLLINRKDVSAAERCEKARKMLELVGLRPEHYERYPHMFSGGQRQRIAIGRALMLEPEILVLDEPVSALDLSIQSQVLNLLVDLQDKLDLAYLFISHDLSVVKHMADEIMVMYLGRAVEFGTKEQVFENPRHPYTKALLSATPQAKPKSVAGEDGRERIKLSGELPSPLNVPTGCAFNPRCWRATNQCRQERPELLDLDANGQKAACFSPLD